MKTLISILTIFLLFANTMAQKNLNIESINTFSFKILEQVKSDKENCFYSPFSIFGALSMTYAGAKENTKLEMEKVLEITDNSRVHQDFLELSNALRLERDFTFLSSNSLWLQKSMKPEKEYIKAVEENYNAKIERVNFAGENDREKARLEINECIDKQTKGNLLNFLPKGLLDESTMLILINAVYFNGIWNTEFPSDKITSGKFYPDKNDSLDCNMLNLQLETSYYEDDLMQVVEIPYQNKKSSMMVFLPKADVKTNTENFNYEYLKKISRLLVVRDVTLSIPKFKMAVNYELSESLKKMGMKVSFEPGADFSGITGNKSLILDKVLHKSVIDVTEKGSEAASSTAVISMRSTKIALEKVEFKANRPFYFIIKQNTGNLILFMGYLSKP